MEASTAVRVGEVEEATRPEVAAATNATPGKMFQYSEYVDVGPGAWGCDHGRDGACADIEHFHAWCRLPNPLQHRDIREKAMAAKARRIRALRDPESDSHAVMEGELSEINDVHFEDLLIDELLVREWADDYLTAQREVDDREGFEHIVQDREEYQRLLPLQGELPLDEQSDEWKALQKQIGVYLDAIKVEVDKLQEPRREGFKSRGFDALMELVWSKRIEEDANRTFLDVYNTWMWYIGTYHVDLHETVRRPWKPMWTDIGDPSHPTPNTMYSESPEVIDQLKDTFNRLSQALHQGISGN